MEILRVENLCKTYGKGEAKVDALKGVSFSLEKGEFAAVVGESGSGKSTLLNCIGALDTPTSGSILIDGQNLFSMKEEKRTIFRRRNIGFIFQSFQLVSELNVEQNIMFPLLLDYRKPDPAEVEEILELLGLKDRRCHLPNQLSGGQRQRAWIAMTLAQETEMILLDEPTTYLDMAYQLDVLQLLERMNREKQLTIVMVLHDLNEACRFADHIIGLKNGKVVCEGRPADVITRENIREIYGIDAKLVMSDGGYPICMEFDRVIKTL